MTTPSGPILFNSSTGSDSLASGLGPATAVNGSGASTTATSAVVTGIDTTGVSAGDLLWVESSSGRQFSVIASVDSATQVTCDDVFANTESGRNWAIGGKRLSLGSTSSRTLFGTSGMAAGWVLELEDGYTETLLSELEILASGDTTSGPCVLKGVFSATAKPVLTFSNNGRGIYYRGNRWKFIDFDLKNTHATKTGSTAIFAENQGRMNAEIRRVNISDSTDNFHTGVRLGGVFKLVACEIAHAVDDGIQSGGNTSNHTIAGCYVHHCGVAGLDQGNQAGVRLLFNVFANNGGNGAELNTFGGSVVAAGNVFHGNGGSGLLIGSSTSADLVVNNTFTSSGAYGISNESGLDLMAEGGLMDYNAFHNNTSGPRNNLSVGEHDVTLTTDPYTDAATGDFTLNSTAGGGADCADAGFPQMIPGA